MAVPWLTVGKLVLGNLDSILGVVRPAFTRKKLEEADERTRLLSQQIAELQTASATNAEQVKELALQLKEVVAALEQAAIDATAERASRRRLVNLSLGVAVVALLISIGALWMSFGRIA